MTAEPKSRAEFKERVKFLIERDLDVLNRLESHLGCAKCRGPLTDGRCPKCQGPR